MSHAELTRFVNNEIMSLTDGEMDLLIKRFHSVERYSISGLLKQANRYLRFEQEEDVYMKFWLKGWL